MAFPTNLEIDFYGSNSTSKPNTLENQISTKE